MAKKPKKSNRMQYGLDSKPKAKKANKTVNGQKK